MNARFLRRWRRHLILLIATLRCRWFARTDVARWSLATEFESSWDERARIAASLIPAGTRVFDFGAGTRNLERFLDHSCCYTPCDVVPRGPGTVLLDLNRRPLPSIDNADVAVFCGVLEYVRDVDGVVHWLVSHFGTCIASYNCATSRKGTLARRRESLSRAVNGWVSTIDEPELRAIFAAEGFELVARHRGATSNGDEPIFMFRRT